MTRKAQPRRQGQGTHTIESLTRISIDVFMKRGYEATSVEQIAQAAGITKSAIYYHVASKEELLSRAISSAVRKLFEILAEPGSEAGTPLARLEYIFRRLVEVEFEYLKEIALLLRVRGTTKTERWALQKRREFDRLVQGLIEQAQAAGEIRNDIDALVIDRLVFGMLTWIPEWYHAGHNVPRTALVEAAIALILEGIRRPRSVT
jgi:AcrR family transcriptional regulator